ncbi:MAG: hypothetical protein CVU77_07225 [Elusimicrobia bacterium HGW-Elusimicrobia-1]|nr:MAG: hypothetical protein CVU77_07225 [Elusimicrobia bacterium HGW-Elusimicrobia-1]
MSPIYTSEVINRSVVHLFLFLFDGVFEFQHGEVYLDGENFNGRRRSNFFTTSAFSSFVSSKI